MHPSLLFFGYADIVEDAHMLDAKDIMIGRGEPSNAVVHI